MSENQNVNDAFNAALAASQRNRKEREEQRMGGGGSGFTNYQYMGLEDGVDKVFRIVGAPFEVRLKGTDTKLVYFSKLLKDDKKSYTGVIWQQTPEGLIDKDWILYELYDTIMAKQWENYAPGVTNAKGYTGEYKFVYENTETFKRLKFNTKKDASPKFFPPTSNPKARILMNVIDRHDSWCVDNKHTKVLVSRLGEMQSDKGTTIYFPERGVPEMLYNKIMDDVVAYRFNWNLDVVARKNSKDLNNAYIVRDILEDKIAVSVKALGNANPMTPEELSYELYDFDEQLGKVLTYTLIRKNFIGLFKMFDGELNKDLTSKLERLVEEEQKKMTAEQKAKAEKEESEEEGSTSDDAVQAAAQAASQPAPAPEREKVNIQTPAEQPAPAPSRRAKPQENAEINFADMFPAWVSVPEKEQELYKQNIKSFNGHIPVFKQPERCLPCPNEGCVYPGSTERTVFPDTIVTCAVCGAVDSSGQSS